MSGGLTGDLSLFGQPCKRFESKFVVRYSIDRSVMQSSHVGFPTAESSYIDYSACANLKVLMSLLMQTCGILVMS